MMICDKGGSSCGASISRRNWRLSRSGKRRQASARARTRDPGLDRSPVACNRANICSFSIRGSAAVVVSGADLAACSSATTCSNRSTPAASSALFQLLLQPLQCAPRRRREVVAVQAGEEEDVGVAEAIWSAQLTVAQPAGHHVWRDFGATRPAAVRWSWPGQSQSATVSSVRWLLLRRWMENASANLPTLLCPRWDCRSRRSM
jgi:hypothetical protein